jgi:hypothetical protein
VTIRKKAHSDIGRLRVTRADVHMPDDSDKTVEQLQADIDRAGPKSPSGDFRSDCIVF